MAADTFGTERFVFGTDFPYANRSDLRGAACALETLGSDVSREIFEATLLFGSGRREP